MPCVPRSSNVSAIPVPNNCSHKRFTMVLDVSGFCLLVNHIATPKRLWGAFFGNALSACGTSGCTTAPFTSQLPFSNTLDTRCMSVGLSIITGVVATESFLIKLQYVFFFFLYL